LIHLNIFNKKFKLRFDYRDPFFQITQKFTIFFEFAEVFECFEPMQTYYF